MSNRPIIIPEFEQTMGDLMSAINNITKKRHRSAMKVLDITSLQGMELTYIVEAEKDGGTSQSVICELLSITPPAVLKMTRDLEERGLIVREKNPKDKRSQILFPTPEGKEISKTFREILLDCEDKVYACCTEEERKILFDILAKIVQANQ